MHLVMRDRTWHAFCNGSHDQMGGAMRLFELLTGAVQSFAPADGQTVRLYVCGITPYDTTHIGHAFTYLTFDVLNRLCQHVGWNVRYVQNVTDVDDDIMRRARDTGEHWQRLGARHTSQFQEDLAALAVLPPDVYPRASDEIPAILDLIGTLMTSGCAYARKGAVFFRVAADPTYGQFARLTRDELVTLSAERGADPSDPRKEDPLDFVLWQPSEPDEPWWDSPWGAGRPGWHIECSAMATHHLGPQLDVHGGGGDLIFPHHESEIAQSECATGVRPFARFWVHVAMVRYAGEKMSKSLAISSSCATFFDRTRPMRCGSISTATTTVNHSTIATMVPPPPRLSSTACARLPRSCSQHVSQCHPRRVSTPSCRR